MVALHLALECYFGAGKKAHRHIRFSDGSKPSREEIELVTSLSLTFAGRDATL